MAEGAGEIGFARSRLVRQEDDFGLAQSVEGRQDSTNARVVKEGLGRGVKRAVQVDPKKHGASGDLDVVEREDAPHVRAKSRQRLSISDVAVTT
jgi:hypothetical protein